MDNIIQLNIELDNNESTADHVLRSGFLIVSVEESITIEGINVQLLERVKGKMSSQKTSVHTTDLARGMQVLRKGETYRFSFELPRKPNIESYKGKNFSILYELDFKVELEQTSYDNLEKGVFKNIKSFFTGEKHHKQAFPITFEQPIEKYEIVEVDGDFSLKRNNTMLAIVGVLFLLVSLFLSSMDVLITALVTVLGLMLGYFLQKLLIPSFIGKFSLELTQKDNETFLAVVQSGNHWKSLSDSNLRYEVIEEVIDRRGTSTSTYTETLFSSPTVSLNNEAREAVFVFPERHFPMIKIQDASIKWLMKLEMKTSIGFKLKYDKVFEVK
jgi:hypothetical protein